MKKFVTKWLTVLCGVLAIGSAFADSTLHVNSGIVKSVGYSFVQGQADVTSFSEGATSGTLRIAVRPVGSTGSWGFLDYPEVTFAEPGSITIVATGLSQGTSYEAALMLYDNAGGSFGPIDIGSFETSSSGELGVNPVGSIEAAVVDNGRARVTLGVDWAGTGAQAVSATLRWGVNEGALVHSLSVENLIGKKDVIVGSLLPNETYVFQATYGNGGGGTTTVQTSQVMPTQILNGQNVSEGSWTSRARNTSTESPAENNVLLGLLPTTYTGVWTERNAGDLPLGKWGTDGVIRTDMDNTMGVRTGCVLGYSFDEPLAIAGLRFYTANWGGRGNINISSISATRANGDEVELAGAHSRSGSNNFASFEALDGKYLVCDAVGLKITFGSQDNNGVHYQEIEAIGYPIAATPLTVISSVRDGNAVGAMFTFPALRHDGRAYACLGNTWIEGMTTNGWSQVVDCGAVSAGATSFSTHLDNDNGFDFVRFVIIANENPIWQSYSETVALADCNVATSAPTLSMLVAESDKPGAATLTCGLLSAGAGKDAASLKLVYSHDGFVYTNLVATGTAALGNHVVRIANLKPGAEYSVYVVADNGAEGGTSVSETVSVAVMDEDGPSLFSEKGTVDSGFFTSPCEPSSNNLIRGVQAVLEAGAVYGSCPYANLTDGVINNVNSADSYFTMCSPDNTSGYARLRWDLPSPSSIDALKLYCCWSDGRACISVSSVEVQDVAGNWLLVPNSRFNVGSSAKCNYATFTSANDSLPLATLAKSIRVCFTNDNSGGGQGGWRAYREVEVLESAADLSQWLIGVASISLDGDNAATVRIVRDADKAPMVNLYAMCGPTLAYESGVRKVATLAAGETDVVLRVPIGAGDNCLRFKAVWLADDGYTETSNYQYSRTQLLYETPKHTGSAPALLGASVTPSSTSASFLLNVLSIGASAENATAIVRYGAASDQLTESADLVSEQGGLPGLANHVLGGLLSSTAYFAQVGVSNNLGEVTWYPETFSFTTTAGEVVSASSVGATVSSVGADTVFNFSSDGTMTVATPGWVEMLLVGGGGGGGGQVGGGGGAGGFVYTNVFLAAGEYMVQVGAGGAGGTVSTAGGRGGDTTFRLSDGEGVSITAFGGGGGDEWDSQLPQGSNFGSAGGATNSRYPTWSCTPGQGNDGGRGDDACGGGGGGADEAGGYSDLFTGINGMGHAGKGGDGLPCRITGTLLYYAGGGGGGVNNYACYLGGWGGLGGGGRGRDYNVTDMAGMAGVDGFGGGGGGGGNNSNPYTYDGARGGSGCAIIRFTPAPIKAASAAVSLSDVKAGNGSVALSVRVISTGRATKGVLKFVYGANPSELDHEITLSSNAMVGSGYFNVDGLRSSQPYYGKVTISTDQGVSAASPLRYFVTKKCDDAAVDVGAPVLGDVSVVTNRAELTVIAGRVKGDVAEMKLFLGTNGDQLNEVVSTVAISAAEDGYSDFYLTTTEDLSLDKVYYYTVQATNSQGIDRTELSTFRTPQLKAALPSGWQSAIWPRDQNTPGTVKFSARLNYLGAGENFLLLYFGKGDLADGDLRNLEPIMVQPVYDYGKQTFVYEIPWDEIEWGTYYSYAFAVSNVYKGVSYFAAPSRQQDYKFTFTDPGTYTWTGAGDGTSWTDSTNWTCTVEGGLGWPNAGATVLFPAATTADVTIVRDVSIARINFQKDNLNLKFKSPEGEYHTLKVATSQEANCGENRKIFLTFDHVGVYFNQSGVNYQYGPGSEILITNGAYVHYQGQNNTGFWLRKDNSKLIVEKRSTFSSSGYFILGGTGTEVVIDDSRVVGYHTYMGYQTSPFTMRFRGESPRFESYWSYRNEGNSGAVSTNVFEVPVGGYARPPIVHSTTNSTQAQFFTPANNNIVMRVDPNSPALKAGGVTKTKLVDSYLGIANKDKLVFDLPGAYDEVSWKYGSNAADRVSLDHDEPETASSLPTSIWLKLGSAPEGLESAQFGETRITSLSTNAVSFACSYLVPLSASPVSLSVQFDDGEIDQSTLIGTVEKVFSYSGLAPSTDHVLKMTLGTLTTNITVRTMGADSKAIVGSVSGASVSSYGPYTVYVFDDPSAVNKLTLTQAGPVEILVVGAGGSGASGRNDRSNQGGGGGGGGSVIHRTSEYLMPGEYSIEIGVGANCPKTWSKSGEKGGNTTFFGADFTLTAVGGGYGAYSAVGGNGGCGGGGQNNGSAGGSTVGDGIGFAGGKGWSANEGAAGGGGGAGSAGGAATAVNVGGKGGDGYACDITGAVAYYGAGGAGGGSVGNSGADGLGYGGYGSGGRGGSGTSWSLCENGRDGVVIVRLLTTSLDADEPAVEFRHVVATNLTATSATIVWELFSLGTGASSVDAKLVWELDSGLVLTNDIATAIAAPQLFTSAVQGLAPDSRITARILVVNDQGASALSEVFSFTTPNELGFEVADVVGLWQAWFASASKAWTKDIMTVAEGTAFLGTRRRELGTIAGYLGSGPRSTKYTSELWGDQVYWNANSYQGAYCGYMKMVKGRSYRFRGYIDDDFHVEVTDPRSGTKTVLVENSSCKSVTSSAYVPSYTGWYYVGFRFSDAGSGNAGGYSNVNSYKNTTNFGYSDDDGTTWNLAIDPGDGSLFRTKGVDEPLTLVSAIAQGDNLEVSVLDRDGTTYPLSVVYGSTYGGDDPADWESGAVATGVTMMDVAGGAYQATIPNAASARYVRAFYVANEICYWSNSFFVPAAPVADSTPMISVVGSPVVAGQSVSQNISVLTPGVGQTSCDIYIAYGLESGKYVFTNKVVSAAEAGALTAQFGGLRANRTYYAAFYAVNAVEGVSELTSEISFTTEPGVETLPVMTGPRTITIAAKNATAGILASVDLAFGACAEDFSQDLYVAYGAAEGSKNSTNGWDSVVKISDTPVNAATTTWHYDMPAGWGSSINALRFFFGKQNEGETITSVKDYYAANGLIAMWDGEDNSGTGTHDPSATVWKDLVGDNDFVPNSTTTVTFGDNYITATSAGWAIARHELEISGPITYEIVFNASSGSSVATFGSVPHKNYVWVSSSGWMQYASQESAHTRIAYPGYNTICQYSVTKADKTDVECYNKGSAAGYYFKDYWHASTVPTIFVETQQPSPTAKGRGASGCIYCIRVYNRVLSAEEIAENARVDGIRFMGDEGVISSAGRIVLASSSETLVPQNVYPGPEINDSSVTVTGLETGDSVTISGSAVGLTAGSTATILHQSEDADGNVVWVEYPAVIDGNAFSGTICPAVPGGANSYVVRVTDANGYVDLTPAATFTPLAASALSGSLSVTFNQRTATLKYNLAKMGAGDTYAYLMTSDTSTTDPSYYSIVGDPVLLTMTGSQTGSYTFSSFATSSANSCKSFGVMISNSCSHVENGSWTSYLLAQHNSTDNYRVMDKATYTWIGGTEGGNWNDPANWSSDKADCLGYPNYGSTAKFDGEAVVRVNESVVVNNITTGAAGTSVRILGNGTKTLQIRTNLQPAENTTITFDERVQVTLDTQMTLAPLSNAAKWDNARINVFGGSYVYVSHADGIRLGGTSTLCVSNATVSAVGIYFGYMASGGVLSLCGDSPFVQLTKECRLSNNASTRGGTIHCSIPVNGYEQIPLVIKNAIAGATKFGGDSSVQNFANCGPISISVDPNCGAMKRDGLRSFPVVCWEKGVTIDRVTAGDLPNSATDSVKVSNGNEKGPWLALSDATEAKYIGVELLGTQIGRPGVRDLTLLVKSEDAATFTAVVTPGETAPNAQVRGVLTLKSDDPTIEDIETEIPFGLVTNAESLVTFTLSNLIPGTNYTFAVEATSTPADSEDSLMATAGPLAFSTDALSADAKNPKFSSLVCVETNAASATFSYFADKLGYGATQYDLYLVYAHDAFTYTNTISTSSVLGALSYVLKDLKPNTTYTASLYATNDVEGVYTSEALTFKTVEEETANASEVPKGCTQLDYIESTNGQWIDTGLKFGLTYDIDYDFYLPSGKTGSSAIGGAKWDWSSSWLTQAEGYNLRFNDNSVIGTIPAGARTRFSIRAAGGAIVNGGNSVNASRAYDWGRNTYALFAVNGGDYNTNMRLYRFTAAKEGANLIDLVPCKDQSGVVCLYDTVTETFFYNKKAGTEFVAGDVTEIPAGMTMKVENTSFDGTVLVADLVRELTDSSESIIAMYGANYGGCETNTWEHAVTLPIAFGEGQSNATVSVSLPADARYVRFATSCEWTESVFLPEHPVTADPNIRLSGLSVTGTTVVEADIAFNVSSIGTGASSYDVFVIYAHDGFVYTNAVLAGGTAAGAYTCTLKYLRPETEYSVSLYATNNVGGAGYAEAVSFATLEEMSAAGRGGALPAGYVELDYVESAARGHYVDLGFKPDDTTSFEMEFQVLRINNNDDGLMGGAWDWNNTWLTQNRNGALRFQNDVALMTMSTNERYTITYDQAKTVTVVDQDGNVRATRSNVSGTYTRGNLCLFSGRGDTGYGSPMRLYGLKFWKSGVLAANYIPAKDGNGVACLYEAVAGKTIYSSSANALIAGPVALITGELTVSSANYDGSNLGGAIIRNKTGDSDVYALIGSEYGAYDTNSWERVELLVPSFVGESGRIGYYLSNLGGARYVRFLSEAEGWSETVFLPELPISSDPNPILTAGGLVSVGATSVKIDGTVVTRGTGASACQLIAEYGTAVGVFDKSVVLAEDLMGHGAFTIHGLTPQRTYFIRLKAVNNIGGEATDPLVFTAQTASRGTLGVTVAPAAGVDPHFDTQCTQKDLPTGERVLIFSVATTNNSAVVAKPANVEITQGGIAEMLVVGGGGGHDDATYSGTGGGGGGGFVHYDGFNLDAGSYTFIVGRGALVSDWNQLVCDLHYRAIALGCPSIISNAYGEVVIAYPGGTAGRGGTGPAAGTFGSGAGASSSSAPGSYTASQGNAGGSNGGSAVCAPGGGGGAGTPGQSAYIDNGIKYAGNGGDGKLCEITGEAVYYAAGGGGYAGAGGSGGATANVSGHGGLGGGGEGGGTAGEHLVGGGTASGVDGTGGGVGGTTAGWTHGGSGTIVIRYFPDDLDLSLPAVQLNSIVATNDVDTVPGVIVNARLVSEGSGNAVTVELEYGLDRDVLNKRVTLDSDAVVGELVYQTYGFRSKQTYYGRLKVIDAQANVRYSRVIEFTTSEGDDSMVGLDEPRFTDISPIYTNDEHRVVLNVAGTNFVSGSVDTTIRLEMGDDALSLANHAYTLIALDETSAVLAINDVNWDQLYRARLTLNGGAGTAVSQVFDICAYGATVAGTYNAVANDDNSTIVTTSVTIGKLGAGVTTAKLFTSTTGSENLAFTEELTITATGEWKFAPITYPFGTTLTYRIDVSNEFLGDVWNSTGSVKIFEIKDGTVYTWKGGVTSGVWTDVANWVADGSYNPYVGYPTKYATAQMPTNFDCTVTIPSTLQAKRILLNGSNCSLTLKGAEGTVRPRLSASHANNPFNFDRGSNYHLTLDNVDLGSDSNNDDIKFGNYNTIKLVNAAVSSQGAGSYNRLNTTSNLLWLTQGSVWKTSNYGLEMNGNNCRIIVEDESRLTDGNASITLGGNGNELVISNGTVAIAGSWSNYICLNGNVKVRFLGTHPQMMASRSIYALEGSSPEFVFNIPEAGYVTAPVYGESSSYTLGDDSRTLRGKIKISVDPTCEASTLETEGEYPLLKDIWGGIDANAFELLELPYPQEDFYRWETDASGLTNVALYVHLLGRNPTPTAPLVTNIYVANSTNTSVTVAGTFRLGGTSPSASLAYRYARADQDFTGEYTQILSSTVVTNGFSITMDGLTPGTDYKVEFKGSNAVGDTVLVYPFSTLGDVAVLESATGYSNWVNYGPYAVVTFTNAAEIGTFKVSRGGRAEVLVVGGGGAGGRGSGYSYAAGGGGGGGVTYSDSVLLSSGDFFVHVGKGGAATTLASMRNNGEASSINTAGGVILSAEGGGCGGGAGDYNGGAGANGGGAVGPGVGGIGTSGFNGGDGNGRAGGSGGAGAGEDGHVGDASASNGTAGHGGDGFLCRITGYDVYYGGGGAGGSHDGARYSAKGGKGGGADSRYRDVPGIAGADGFGGGGAGGGASSSQATQPGGAGGTGCVIVRIRTTPVSDAPIVQYRYTTVEGNVAAIESEVFDFGGSSEALTYKVKWGFAEDALVYEHDAGRVAATGIISTSLTGLPAQSLIFAKLIYTSELTGSSSESDVFAFTTGAGETSWEDAFIPAFGETVFSGNGGDVIDVKSIISTLGGSATSAEVDLYVSSTSNFEEYAKWELGSHAAAVVIAANAHTADTNAVNYIKPGNTNWVALVARATDGSVGASKVAKVVTRAGSAIEKLEATVVQSVVRFTVTMKNPIGCNDTALTLFWSTDDGATWRDEPLGMLNAASNTLSFTSEKDFGEFDVKVMMEVVSSNGCESASWMSSKTATVVTDDVATYTWKANEEGEWNGDWEDPAHWKASLEPNYGYPKSRGCKAEFGSITTNQPVIVSVSGVHTNIGLIRSTGANYNLTLRGISPGATLGAVAENNDVHFAANNGVLTIDGLTFSLRHNGNLCNFKMSASGNSLRLVNGATMNVSTVEMPAASNRIEVVDSTLNCGTMNVNGAGERIVLDNGKINANNLAYYGGGSDSMEMLFKGNDAEFKVNGSEAPGRVRTLDRFVFCVPVNGFAKVPLHKSETSTDTLQFNVCGGNVYERHFAVAKDSPIFRGTHGGVYPMVRWSTGFNITSNIVLEVPSQYTARGGKTNRLFFVDRNGAELTDEQIRVGNTVYGISAELYGLPGLSVYIR